jgi:hypothetical protein
MKAPLKGTAASLVFDRSPAPLKEAGYMLSSNGLFPEAVDKIQLLVW